MSGRVGIRCHQIQCLLATASAAYIVESRLGGAGDEVEGVGCIVTDLAYQDLYSDVEVI